MIFWKNQKKKNYCITFYDYDLNIKITMATRIYCYDSPENNYTEVCKVPGPTWIMQAGETSKVGLYNDLVGRGVLGVHDTPGRFRDMSNFGFKFTKKKHVT